MLPWEAELPISQPWPGVPATSYKVGMAVDGGPVVYSSLRFFSMGQASEYKAWLYGQGLDANAWLIITPSRMLPTHVFHEGAKPRWWRPWRRRASLTRVGSKVIY